MKLFIVAFNKIGFIFSVFGKCKLIIFKFNKGDLILFFFYVEKG